MIIHLTLQNYIFIMIHPFIVPLIMYATMHQLTIVLTPTNHVSIKGPIDESTSAKFISKMNKIKSNHIYIYIDSPGGSVDAGQRIIQYMNYKKDMNKTLLCITQQASSMAFHIFQYCTHRYILQDSKMMQHQMSIRELSGNIESLNNYMKVSNRIYDTLINNDKNI